MTRKPKVMDGRAFNREDEKRWYISSYYGDDDTALDPTLCRWFHTRSEARKALRQAEEWEGRV